MRSNPVEQLKSSYRFRLLQISFVYVFCVPKLTSTTMINFYFAVPFLLTTMLVCTINKERKNLLGSFFRVGCMIVR